ncbi:alpha/beta hydrolase [Streptococcus oriscaviae]|uniref:Prolyl oligopeptidase family serine peptidase n=1 Tax=Streptococcus oriscaviae TaxID=2781599 RepID=A0ABX7YML2_9STRE|nr:prolyl oligopeptidase family serine peptidase [Streptococcus oriscaviae]QUE54975.1 prolyl oligopeptidase family serine peptidase [Streptococcus oriscaviae]
MKIIKRHTENKKGEKLCAHFFLPKNNNGAKTKFPLVVMLTGDGPSGSKSLSWTKIPPLLSEKGIASLTFDFSGLGDSEGSRKELTLEKGIDDFKAVIKLIDEIDAVDTDRIGVFSSSFGSSVVIASKEFRDIKAHGFKSPCTFLPDAYLNEISEEAAKNWKTSGYCSENGYNINVLYNPMNYNIYRESSDISSSCLITHGLDDEIVPFRQSQLLQSQLLTSSNDVELVLIENCDHGYTQDGKWEYMANLFVDFFVNKL